jgi:hypothetical protein
MKRTIVAIAALASLLAAPASAYEPDQALGEPTLDLAFNPGFSANDDFVHLGGLGLRVAFRPIRLLGVDFMLAGMPDRGEGDYTSLTGRFRNEEEVVPDISRLTSATLVSFVTSPLVGQLHSPTSAPHFVAWYLLIGGGGVSTRDDTAIVRSPCAEYATMQERKADTANGCQYVDQVHPAFTFGTGLRGRFFGALLVGLEVRVIAYTEEIFRPYGGPEEVGLDEKKLVWWSLQVGASLPPKLRDR